MVKPNVLKSHVLRPNLLTQFGIMVIDVLICIAAVSTYQLLVPAGKRIVCGP